MKIRTTICKTILCASVILSGTAITLAEDWPQWLGLNRNGISPEKDITGWGQEKPTINWRTSIGIGYSSFAVVDNKCYTMGNVDNNDFIYCINTADGKTIWKQSYPCTKDKFGYHGPRSTPVVDNGFVYTLSLSGDIMCWNADSGKQKWKTTLASLGLSYARWGFSCSPMILGDNLIIQSGKIVALNKDTGKLVWKSKASALAAYSSPTSFTLGNKTLIAGFAGDGLHVVDSTNGKHKYSFKWKTSYNMNAVTPIVNKDTMFIASGYRVGSGMLNLKQNKAVLKWKTKDLANHCANSVMFNGYLFGFSGNVKSKGERVLQCLNIADGKLMWSKKGLGAGTLIVADDKLIILGEKGQLLIAEASGKQFTPLTSTQTILPNTDYCWTPPVISNGKLFCRGYAEKTGKSDIVCIDLKPKSK